MVREAHGRCCRRRNPLQASSGVRRSDINFNWCQARGFGSGRISTPPIKDLASCTQVPWSTAELKAPERRHKTKMLLGHWWIVPGAQGDESVVDSDQRLYLRDMNPLPLNLQYHWKLKRNPGEGRKTWCWKAKYKIKFVQNRSVGTFQALPSFNHATAMPSCIVIYYFKKGNACKRGRFFAVIFHSLQSYVMAFIKILLWNQQDLTQFGFIDRKRYQPIMS